MDSSLPKEKVWKLVQAIDEGKFDKNNRSQGSYFNFLLKSGFGIRFKKNKTEKIKAKISNVSDHLNDQ